MKRYIYYISTLLILTIAGCTKDFGTLNENPNSLSTPTPAFLFSKSQLSAMSNSYYLTAVLNLGGFIQHYATYKEVPELEISILPMIFIRRLILPMVIPLQSMKLKK